MKKLLLATILFLSLPFCGLPQTNSSKHFIKLSLGKVFFGTGDVAGFSIAIDASKNIFIKPRIAVNKLLLGFEIGFENGMNSTTVYNQTDAEFIHEIFHHVSNTFFTQS